MHKKLTKNEKTGLKIKANLIEAYRIENELKKNLDEVKRIKRESSCCKKIFTFGMIFIITVIMCISIYSQ